MGSQSDHTACLVLGRNENVLAPYNNLCVYVCTMYTSTSKVSDDDYVV